MTFHYVNISAGHTFNIDLGTAVVRAGSITTGFIERAELGEVGMGAVELDDPSGTLDITGLQRFSVSESAVGGDFVYVSQIKERTVRRGDSARASLRTGADRVWSLTLADQNYILTNRKVFEGDGGKRPAETASARLTWLLGITYIGIHDWGYVTYPTHAMDACDYTGQDVKSILADIAAAASYNFFGYWDQAHVGIGLWFGDPEGTSFTSSATISNVLSDVGGSCFYSLDDAVLTRSPSRIASRVRLAYTGGAVVVSNSTTLDDFDWVDQEAPMSNVKTASAATAVANAFLAASDGEDDRISVSIRVPAANVNDILAGHRVQAKFSHLPGYQSFTWCRVMSRAVMQDEVDDAQYRIALELVPQGGGAPLSCAVAVGLTAVNGISANTTVPITYYSVPVSISTVAGVAGQAVAFLVGMSGDTPSARDMGVPAGYTGIVNVPGYLGCTWDASSKTVALGATATAATTFTAGFLGGEMYMLAQAVLPTASTSPVQSADIQGVQSGSFASAPTPGNMVLLCAYGRPYLATGLGGPWTTLYSAVHTNSVPRTMSIMVLGHCVQAGEANLYGVVVSGGGVNDVGVVLMEWALT